MKPFKYVHWLLLIVAPTMLLLSSCSDNLRLMRVTADNDRYAVALDIVDTSKGGGSILAPVVKENIEKFTTICNQNNILNFVKCNSDTSEVQVLVQIFGSRQVQIFFDAVNNFKIFKDKPLFLKLHLYNNPANKDSITIQAEFPLTILTSDGSVVFKSTDSDTKYYPKVDNERISVTKLDDNGGYEYRAKEGKGSIMAVLSMKYLRVPDDQKRLPHQTQSAPEEPVVEKYKYYFTNSLVNFLFGLIGTIAAIFAIVAGLYNFVQFLFKKP